MKTFFSSWKQDIPASIVVFLVALPLCLGVGLASTNNESIHGMPNIFAGLIAGVVGGVVVGALSKSKIGVSGPAAGLITIVLASITSLGSFENFLVAVVISGAIQLIAGFAGLGSLGNYFPTSVIKGMLAAIGITLILKEIPHALGYDKDFFGDESFFQADGHNTFSELLYALNAFSPGSILISTVSLSILIILENKRFKSVTFLKYVPSALLVVLVGIGFNSIAEIWLPYFHVSEKHLVAIPVSGSLNEFAQQFSFPDWSSLSNPKVYSVALTIALVGSLETLLSVEATDKLDPERNSTPTNEELKAQGIGNMVSGLIGGLPVTQVIVRSSANVSAGGRSRLSTMLHGMLLFICIFFIPGVLNKIPLASLAAILIMVGYKLSKIELYKKSYHLGIEQFLPFISTILGVVLTDLLKGIAIGLLVAIFFILRRNYKRNFILNKSEDGKNYTLTLSENVSYLNKGSISSILDNLPEGIKLTIVLSKSKYIDYDVLEFLEEFENYTAKRKQITLEKIN
jgi:carbonic anhydrase